MTGQRQRARRRSASVEARRRDEAAQERAIRDRLGENERLLAFARGIPTASDRRRRQRASAEGLSAVTDRRVLWREVDEHGQAQPRELAIDDVTSAYGKGLHHRWTLHLLHPPIERCTHTPAYHLGFIAGGNRSVRRDWLASTFSFSRHDTEMAVALRDQLARRGVTIRELPPSPVPPRLERTGATPLSATYRRARGFTLGRRWWLRVSRSRPVRRDPRSRGGR